MLCEIVWKNVRVLLPRIGRRTQCEKNKKKNNNNNDGGKKNVQQTSAAKCRRRWKID